MEPNFKYDSMEVSKMLGEPKDPRKPYSEIVSLVCFTDTAEPEDYVYHFDVLAETDKVYVITSTGAVTQELASPDTPAELTFIDCASPEYYVKLVDLAKAKERVLARKVLTVTRALDAWETYKVLDLAWDSTDSARAFDLADSSGATHFNYEHLVKMIDSIQDYADNYVLIVGTTIDRDMKLWNWLDNKYHSLKAALEDLNVTVKRVFGTVKIDGATANTDILAATKAILFGLNSQVGKPLVFVRRKLSSVDLMGGDMKVSAGPERYIYVSPNPVPVSSNRYLGVGIVGMQEVALACSNPYALATFSRE